MQKYDKSCASIFSLLNQFTIIRFEIDPCKKKCQFSKGVQIICTRVKPDFYWQSSGIFE